MDEPEIGIEIWAIQLVSKVKTIDVAMAKLIRYSHFLILIKIFKKVIECMATQSVSSQLHSFI